MKGGWKNRQLAQVLSILMISNALFIGIIAADSPPKATEPAEDLFMSVTQTISIDAGDMSYVYFDPETRELYALPQRQMSYECELALSMVPNWLKVNLSYKFRQLSSDDQTTFANLIINSPDEKYIDEIAFVIAHSSVSTLTDDYFFPELITHNAQLIYSNDQFLNYVDVIEKDDYTTVVYKDRDNLSVELPRELYYFYIVHPKLSDELPTYVDPDYDFTKTPPFDRNYGVPPEDGGKFWREWLFYYNDSGHPLLKDKLGGAYTVWEAISASNSWMSGSMSFTSNEERPIQPVRIYRKHIGRCGEYQDMRNAIARAGLIPSTCTSNSAEDHMWNEFWDNRWIHWDGGVDNPRMYENGWGKKISSVWIFRGDTSIWSVSHKYTDVCYYTATVLDDSGNPVDGALVNVATENYYNPDLLTTTTWGTTDYTGTVMIPLGDERNFWSSAESDSLGNDPTNGVTQIITDSVAWTNYSHTFNLPMSADSLNVDEITNPGAIDPKYRMNVKYEVVANILETESRGGDWYSQGGNIDFFIANTLNYNLYSSGVSFNAYNVDERSSSSEHLFVLPNDDRYYNVLSNEFSQATCKIVRITVEIYSNIRVDITSPSSGTNYNLGDQIYITGTSWAPNGIENVQIWLDDSGDLVYATDTSIPDEPPYSTWEYYLNTDSLMPGDHIFWANATSVENHTKVNIQITLHDATDPDLQIDAPLENSQHVVGDEILVNGSATDNIEISLLTLVVDFDYNNSIDITSSLVNDDFSYGLYTGGWSIDDHSITVTTQDPSGNIQSITRNIRIIELIDPVVLIETPSEGEIIKLGDLIDISGIANDNVEVVDLELIIDSSTSIDLTSELQPDGSWSYSWDSQPSFGGYHTIEVVATDSSGNTNSHSIEIILDGMPPEASLITPVESSKYKLGETITIEGTASDDWGIYIALLDFDNDVTLDITSLIDNGYWTYEIDADDLGEGEHVISYLVADMSMQSIFIQRNIHIHEAVEPEVTISRPRNKLIVKRGDIVKISGSAYDNKDIESLQIKIDDSTPINITANLMEDGLWSYDWDTQGFSPYEHVIEVIATDSSENFVSDSISIIVDSDTPDISIWLLEEQEVYSAGSPIDLAGTASDDWKLSSLRLQIDDSVNIDITGKIIDGQWEYRFTNTQGLSSGEHTFTLTAWDSVGHERKTTIDVVIDAEFPEVGIFEIEESIIPGETITISGFADDDIDISQIVLYIDDEDPIVVTPTYKNGKWQYELDTTDMTLGKHKISVMVSDSVENQAYYDIRIKLIEEFSPQEEEEVPEEDEKDKIGPFELEMFVLIAVITIMLIIAILAIAVSRGKKK